MTLQNTFVHTLLLALAFFPLTLCAQEQDQTLLVQNLENSAILPKRFRTTDDPLKQIENVPAPSLVGFRQLHASGSGQFSQKSLQLMLERLNHPSNLYIIDLRQESHGFLNGIAVSWYAPQDWGNKGKSLAQIQAEEKHLLQAALKKKNVTVYKILAKSGTGYISSKEPIDITVESALTEEQIAQADGLKYLRLPVTDHLKPESAYIDQFVSFVRELPKDAWLHFHCSGGEGRSTTFMAMYDMMRNAKDVSLNDILNRQWLLGGHRFEALPKTSNWKYQSAAERLEFLRLFYQYSHDNQDDFKESWSDFLKRANR